MIYSIILLGVGLASSSIGMFLLIRAVRLINLRISLLEQRFNGLGR